MQEVSSRQTGTDRETHELGSKELPVKERIELLRKQSEKAMTALIEYCSDESLKERVLRPMYFLAHGNSYNGHSDDRTRKLARSIAEEMKEHRSQQGPRDQESSASSDAFIRSEFTKALATISPLLTKKLSLKTQAGRDKKLCEHYLQVIELREQVESALKQEIIAGNAKDPEAHAKKLSTVIPADNMEPDLLEAVLRHAKAPLSANNPLWGAIRVDYDAPTTRLTLSAPEFREDQKNAFFDQHAQRVFQLLNFNDYNSFSVGAVGHMLFPGHEGKNWDEEGVLQDIAREEKPHEGALTVIAALRPELLKEYELLDLCEKHLPFSPEDNRKLVDLLQKRNLTPEGEDMIKRFAAGNDLFEKPELAAHVFQIDPQDPKVEKIALLAALIRRKRLEEREAPRRLWV